MQRVRRLAKPVGDWLASSGSSASSAPQSQWLQLASRSSHSLATSIRSGSQRRTPLVTVQKRRISTAFGGTWEGPAVPWPNYLESVAGNLGKDHAATTGESHEDVAGIGARGGGTRSLVRFVRGASDADTLLRVADRHQARYLQDPRAPQILLGGSRGGMEALNAAIELAHRGVPLSLLGLFSPVSATPHPGSYPMWNPRTRRFDARSDTDVPIPSSVQRAVVLRQARDPRPAFQEMRFLRDPRLAEYFVPGARHSQVLGYGLEASRNVELHYMQSRFPSLFGSSRVLRRDAWEAYMRLLRRHQNPTTALDHVINWLDFYSGSGRSGTPPTGTPELPFDAGGGR